MDSQADEATGLEQSQQWLNFTHIVVYSYLILLLCLGVSGLAALAHELVLWAQERVQEEASRVNPHLRVSRKLLLSFPELQDEFYEWMDKIPAVRWHPRLVFAFELTFPLKFLHKDGCGWLHVLACVPVVILAGVRVALEMRGCPKQTQSMASVHYMTCRLALAIMLMAWGDPCFTSLGPSLTSPAIAATFAAIIMVVIHLTTPCTIQHLPLVCWISGPLVISNVYIRYLWENGGLMINESDPYLIRSLPIAASTLAFISIIAAVRIYLTQHTMVTFLRSVMHRRRD